MINTFSSFFLVTIAAIIGLFIIGNKRLFQTFATVLGITALIFSSSLPVMAAPNSTPSDLGNRTQVQDQYFCRFEESFSSSGDELEGLCVAQGQNKNQSDADIIKAIKSKASDKNENNLIVRVDNGAVLLSGSMKDEEKARTFIKEVEQIPGIYLITVELGFTNTSNSDLG